MINVGSKLPTFSLQALRGGPVDDLGAEPFQTVSSADLQGRWALLFFWPMDFTFVCPTEIAELGRRHGDFADRGAMVLGVSTDSRYVHLAWRKDHPDLRALPYPMLADPKRELSQALGVLHPEEGVPFRASILVDPDGVVRWVSVHDLSVGRSIPEVLRVLDALQTDELCPCNWQKGEKTLTPGED